MRAPIEAARGKAEGDPLTGEALDPREALTRFGHDKEQLDLIHDDPADRAHEVEGERSEAAALAFHALATGRATPLGFYVDAWLAESAYRPAGARG